jgi:hypothetical protein
MIRRYGKIPVQGLAIPATRGEFSTVQNVAYHRPPSEKVPAAKGPIPEDFL